MLAKLKNMSVEKRLKFIKIMTSFFMLFGLLLSFRLWTGHHSFPTIKVFNNLSQIPQTASLFMTIALIGILLASLLWQKKIFYYGILGLTFLLLIEDYMRWQPWVYMYILFFLAFLFDKKNRHNKGLLILQIILAGSYFWAGAHKLNPYFPNVFSYKIALKIVSLIGVENNAVVYKLSYLGYLVPLIEIAVGIGLFTKRYRNTAIVLATFTHIFILTYLSPMGINYNGVVIPWNVAMLISVWILFYKLPNNYTVSTIKKDFAVYVTAILVWVMPAFNIIGLWHNYASFKLYTGNDTYIFAVLNKADLDTAQPNLKPYIFNLYPKVFKELGVIKDQRVISFYHWTIAELNIPFNLNKTTIKQTIKYMHRFDDKRRYPISFLIYKKGKYQKLNEKDYLYE